MSTTNAEHSGHPIEITKWLKRIYDIMLENHHMKAHEIARKVIFQMNVYSIFCIKKLSAGWVPQLLSVDQKRTHVSISKQCFDKFK